MRRAACFAREGCTMGRRAVACFVCLRFGRTIFPRFLFISLGSLGIKGAALHRRSWVSAFLDLADMGGRRLVAFFFSRSWTAGASSALCLFSSSVPFLDSVIAFAE